jgi:hypothetical protein
LSLLCPNFWKSAGLYVPCEEPDGHRGLHHGHVVVSGAEDYGQRVMVMWLAPGHDLLRVDDCGILMRAADV